MLHRLLCLACALRNGAQRRRLRFRSRPEGGLLSRLQVSDSSPETSGEAATGRVGVIQGRVKTILHVVLAQD